MNNYFGLVNQCGADVTSVVTPAFLMEEDLNNG